MNPSNSKMQSCIDNCLDCYQICTQTITQCLEMGEKHVNQEHINLLQDCAKICLTSADFMVRNSLNHMLTCEVCADICKKSAAECEKFEDEFMRACAKVCIRCAQSCEQMAQG